MITALSIGRGGLGRFGNQAFVIAGVIGIACRSGQPFGFPKWVNHDNAGFGLPVHNMDEYFVNPLPPIVNVPFQDYGYFWGYRDINLPTGNWNIDAHMQSDKFFLDYLPMIRHYFRMKDEPEQNEYVAIHYRAGDYSEDPNAYHPRCSKEYYEEAMKKFPEGTKFLVFTDGKQDWINKMGEGFEFANGNYIEDFRLMKRCKSFICANSSFSAMAAILGEHPEKKIVCPSRWFGPTVGLETVDLYPENAIVI